MAMSNPEFVPVVELVDVYTLIEHPANAKKHSKEDNEALALAIRTYGHDQPIVAWRRDNPAIIKGHGRKAATIINHEQHGRAKLVPVVFREDLTEAQADAARIADNASISTEFDTAKLQEELRRLSQIEEIDISTLALDPKELEFLTADLGDMNDDVFVEDISEAVEEQKAANHETSASIDKTAAPIGDALGFKRVTVEQSRRIRAFMAAIEGTTGKTGAEALMSHIQSVMGD